MKRVTDISVTEAGHMLGKWIYMHIFYLISDIRVIRS